LWLASGHRKYTESDVRRLYRIRALQALGLSLAAVAQALEKPEDDITAFRALLRQQLLQVQQQVQQLKALKNHLAQLLSRMDGPAMPRGPSHGDGFYRRSRSGNLLERGPVASVVALWLVASGYVGRSLAGI